MSVPFASSPISLAASDVASPEPSSWNQQVYQRLKLAIALGLRRQLFLAVCDDSTRASELAIDLQTDAELNRQTCLASTQFDPTNSDLLEQIRRALPQRTSESRAVCLQLLGVAALTRQSANHQWSFLRQLREVPNLLSELDASLVCWISRPWLHTIQHSAPEFWRCCTGVFEFCGEPLGGRTPFEKLTPTPPATSMPPRRVTAKTAAPPAQPISQQPVPAQPTPPTQPKPSTSQPTVWQYVEKSLVRAVMATRQEFTASNPVAILQQIERLHRVQADGDRLGSAYQHLGNLYRDRLNRECDFLQCARVAVHLYRRALDCWKTQPPAEPGRLLATLNDIGTLYWMLARQETADSQIRDLEQSVRAYRCALNCLQNTSNSQVRATLHHNLGSVYADLGRIRQDFSDWQQAIAAFKVALSACDADPGQAASIQNNLGTAHWSLAQFGEAATHLTQAVAAYEAALTYYTCDRDEMTYAMLQSNLGTAYWTLSQLGGNLEDLQRAISAYTEALKYRTADRFPAGCAATQNNLGTAYWHLAQQSSDEEAIAYWHQAIAAYEAAITAAGSQTPLTFDLYATYNNLGLTHYHLATRPQCHGDTQIQHINAALDYHLQAFEGWRSQPQRQQTAREAIVRTLRACYDFGGMTVQTAAFSRVPGDLLSEIMGQL